MNIGAWEINSVVHTDALTLLRGLPEGGVDLIVTSPPYDNLRTYNGYSFDFEAIAHESYRVLKDGGVQVWVVGDSKTLASYRQVLYFVEAVGFNRHQTIIWEQKGVPQKRPQAYYDDFEYCYVLAKGVPLVFNPVLKRNHYAGQVNKKGHTSKKGYSFANGTRTVPDESLLTNVWTIGVGGGKTTTDGTKHPAMFPEALAERHILTWSNPGDLVLDYFGGSGTTAKMARNNGRRWLTCDVSAEYCDLMRRRLDAPYTLPMFEVLP